jgi:mutator protein MutT
MGLTNNTALERLIERAEALIGRIEQALPLPLQAPQDWSQAIAWRYRRRGSGQALLEPVRHVAKLGLDELVEIDAQKEKIQRNTEQFVQGKPANNVLLTGARGTGKSSLIKACLNTYAARGLRLIEVDKSDLIDLPDIVEVVSTRPEKFIIFCDDLSFEDGESSYKALKSILDGSVAASTANVLIYATSNRRHLLPEYMKDNETYTHTADGEIHPGEVIEEKISLSERFGLWVSFYPFSQAEYLAIVGQWLSSFGLAAPAIAAAQAEALVWALERGSRSGRVAYQFARDFVGRQAAEAVTEVAVGILIRSDGALLLSTRPQGKPYPGYWEFPGGKLEAGETVEQALRRELIEELGVTIGPTQVWRVTEHSYTHAKVRLHWCKVHEWGGEFEMREGQEMAWQTFPLTVSPVLAGAYPVLDWLQAEATQSE